MKPKSVKRTAGEMHYKGVSDAQPQPIRPPARDPHGPLVHRYLLSGDEEAMDRLVEHTRPKLMAVARRIGDPQDAEDAVQGAYMALVRKRGQGLDAPVMPWLLTTVIRLAYRRKAKQRRQRDLASRLAQPHEGDPSIALRGDAPAQAMLDAEREVAVRAAVAQLPSRYRDPVVLRHLEGLTTKETAALLDVPEGTLRTRLHRAAKLLRSRMAPVVLASLLFLPWCAADAVRQIVPLTRPLLTKATAAYAAAVVVLAGALAFTIFAPSSSGGSAAHRPGTNTAGTTGSGTQPGPGSSERAPAAGETAGTAEVDEPEPAPEDKPVSIVRPRPARKVPDINSAVPPGALKPGGTMPMPMQPPVADISSDKMEIPKPPGMVFLEGGHVPVGSNEEVLAELLQGRPKPIRDLFAHEAPRHRQRVASYWMSRYELTNAQYLRFLQDHAVEFTTRPNGLDTLESLVGELLGDPALASAKGKRFGTAAWRQLYEANRGAIWKAFSNAGKDVLVLGADGKVDLEATAQRCRTEPLPKGLTLSFYSVRPPPHWPGLRPLAKYADHPVRSISYNEAERFAAWAGMHIPTEAEWEWAARGPEGRRFPWGNTWVLDGSHVNWGGKVTDDRHETSTVAVHELEAGRSWCGLYNSCGNVAEWTSSWFDAYPGSKAKRHPYMGSWVKVIRGGSAADGEMIALRSACRNFVGAGPKAPPYPDNAFGFVGVRMAVYSQPGRDYVGRVVRRAAEGHMRVEDFEGERFGAFVNRDWAKAKALSPDHVYVRGRATAVVLVPVTYFLRERAEMQAHWKSPGPWRKATGLKRRTRDSEPRFVVAALHTDLPLEGVDVPDAEAEAAAAKKRRNKRGSAKPPLTRKGRVPAGHYLVVLWHERVALTTTSREFVCFLPELGRKIPSVEVHPRSSRSLGSPTLRPSLEADEGGLDLTVPLGGKNSPDKYLVRVRAALPYAKDAFHAAHARAPWLKSTDGK